MFNDVPPAVPTFEQRAYERDELDVLLGAYEGSIAYLDNQLGDLFTKLEDRGSLDNTIIVIVGDHGESFGEQGPRITEHATSLYQPSLWVPLLIIDPSNFEGAGRIDEAVSIAALPGTLLDMAGVSDPDAGRLRCRGRDSGFSAAADSRGQQPLS